jgi:hypothetical protein
VTGRAGADRSRSRGILGTVLVAMVPVRTRVRALVVGGLCAAAVSAGCASAGAVGAAPSGTTPAPGSTVAGSTISATTVGGGSPTGAKPGERTRPTVSPVRGGTRTSFALALTSRHDLGARGFRYADYRVTVQLQAAHAAGSGCRSSQTHVLRRGASGQRMSLILRPSLHGWCQGQYHGTVVFETGPNCPKSATGTHPAPCPEFATQRTPAGHFVFWVR